MPVRQRLASISLHSPTTPPWIRRALTLLLAMIIATAMCTHLAKLAQPDIDFSLYYFAGAVERNGTYTDTPTVMQMAGRTMKVVNGEGAFGSPTLVGLFYQPLSLIDYEAALMIWRVLAFGTFVLGVWRAGGRHWNMWLLLALLSSCSFVAFSLGNFAFFTTGLLLFTYGSLKSGNDRQAGIALAIATACKLYPAFLLVPLIVRKEWGVVRWTLGPLAILLAVTPLALGVHDTIEAAKATTRLASFVHPWLDNNGIPGMVLRLTDNVTLAQWSSRLALGISVLLIIVLRSRSTPALFTLAILLMCVSQNISWNMYYGVTLMVLVDATRHRLSRLVWGYMILAYFAVNGFAWFTTYELAGLPSRSVISAAMILMLALVIATCRPQSLRDTESTNSPVSPLQAKV